MTNKNRIRLLAATALAAGTVSQTAHAQTVSNDTTQSASGTTAQATGTSSSKEAVTPEDILKEIVVTGRGRQRPLAGGLMIVQRQPETTNSITSEAIAQKMGIAGPNQIIASLPGVNSGQSDPYAMSIRYGFFIRGLPFNKIGWVVDGVNAMDRAYVAPYEVTYADNENIAGLTVLPGSTRIVDPVQSAVGGEVSITIRDPSNTPGLKADYSYGSFNGRRIFAGIDTGEIGNTGIKAFATVSETKAGTYALPKDAIGDRFHTDFKVVKDWGGVATSSLWVSYNKWNVVRSLPITLAQYDAARAAGNNFGPLNYSFNFDPLSNSNNYWKLAVYTRDDVLVSWNNEIRPSDNLTIDIHPYYKWIKSNSPGESSINPASVYTGNVKQTVSTTGLFLQPNGFIPVKANILQNETAYGVNSFVKYNVSSNNELQIGWWYDHWSMDQLNSFSPVSGSGGAANWASTVLYSTSGQVISPANFTFKTNVNVLSFQDTLSFLDDKLKVEIGAKYFMYRLTGNNLVPGPQTAMNYSFNKFLPRATISYEIDKRMQVYANVITETRANSPISTFPNIYVASTGAISQLGNLQAKPETSVGEEIGFRYHDRVLTADVALFNKKLDNNNVTSQAFVNGAGFNSTLSAGGLKIRGATAELALSPIYGFSPYVNAQYLWTQNTDNFQVLNDFLPTKGKTGVQAPAFTATVGLNYDHGPLFGNFLLKYTGSQYSTFMNDAKLPAFTTMDLAVGYRIPEGIVGKEATIRLSVTNLTNKPYLGTFASVQPNFVTTTGINGTVIAGKTPTYWLGSPRAVMATFTTSF